MINQFWHWKKHKYFSLFVIRRCNNCKWRHFNFGHLHKEASKSFFFCHKYNRFWLQSHYQLLNTLKKKQLCNVINKGKCENTNKCWLIKILLFEKNSFETIKENSVWSDQDVSFYDNFYYYKQSSLPSLVHLLNTLKQFLNKSVRRLHTFLKREKEMLR